MKLPDDMEWNLQISVDKKQLKGIQTAQKQRSKGDK